MLPFEFSILDFIQQYLRTDFGNVAMPFLSQLGNYAAVWLAAAFLLLLFPRHRKDGLAVVLAIGMAAVCGNLILKPLAARIRPCDVNTAIQLLIPRPHDYSFPSGHTAAAFGAVSALFFRRNKLWIPAAVLAVPMAFSRLYLYVHYPSDVLAGAILGILLGWAACKLTDAGSSLRHRKHSE